MSGHYYIYQRDPREEKRWLKCEALCSSLPRLLRVHQLTAIVTSDNDSLVTEVDADEIFRETSESHRDCPFCVSLEGTMSPRVSSGVHSTARETDQMSWYLQLAIRTRTSSPTCGWTACEPLSIFGLTFLAFALLNANLPLLTRLAVTRSRPSSANQHERYGAWFRARISRCTCILHFSNRSHMAPRLETTLVAHELPLGSRYRRGVS